MKGLGNDIMMKSNTSYLLLFFLVMLANLGATAQDTITTIPAERTLSLELGGAHNLVGVNFDSRFKGNHGLGYRVGIGYSYGRNDFSFFVDMKDRIHGVAVPLEINYLLGKHSSKLELGVGISLGYYREQVDVAYPDGSSGTSHMREVVKQFGYFTFGNIGYRLQTKRGFMFRVGWAPSINFNDKHCLQRTLSVSYISFGWRL